MTTVKLVAALPLELALHAVVLLAHPPYLASAVALAVSSTTLAIWVVEPAVVHALGAWLHAPALSAANTDDRDPDATTAPPRTSPAPATRPWSSTGRANPLTSAEAVRVRRLADLARRPTSAHARIPGAAPPSNAPRPHRGWRP